MGVLSSVLWGCRGCGLGRSRLSRIGSGIMIGGMIQLNERLKPRIANTDHVIFERLRLYLHSSINLFYFANHCIVAGMDTWHQWCSNAASRSVSDKTSTLLGCCASMVVAFLTSTLIGIFFFIRWVQLSKSLKSSIWPLFGWCTRPPSHHRVSLSRDL
jgi:hypothetical protein